MKKQFLISLTLLGLLGLSSCGDFWAPGIRVYQVQSLEYPFTQSNLIQILVEQGDISLHNHPGSNLLIIMSNYVDAGGWTVGSNFIEENLLFSISNQGSTLDISQSGIIQPDFWNIYAIGSKIHVYLPSSVDIGQIFLSSFTGSLWVDIDNPVYNLILNTATGTVGALNTLCSNLDVWADTGAVLLQNVTAQHLEAETSTGSISTGDGVLDCADIRLFTSTGSIDARLKYADSCTARTETGNLSVTLESWLDSSSLVNLSVSTGNIDLAVYPAAQTDLWVTASVATGGIDNELSFSTVTDDTHSFSGRNGTGNNKVDLSVQTGSIDILAR